MEGATSWLSNGFQSWSQSGMVALADEPTESALNQALTAVGDPEVMRQGNELSWWYTYLGGGPSSMLAGALTAARWKPWAQASRQANGAIKVRLVSGATGEKVTLQSGAEGAGESWLVEMGDNIQGMLERYGKAIPSRRKTVTVAADAGWNSWYELWSDVDAGAVMANAALAKSILEPQIPAGTPLRIVIDDGWQKKWGVWEPNQKFPAGMDGIVTSLHNQGYEVGVWLAPLMVAASSNTVSEHPEWFVEGASYAVIGGEPNRILDVTHPGAAAYLKTFIQRIVSWGFKFLKIDFLFGGTYEGKRHEAVTGMEAYHRALELIRQAAGEQVILLAVGAPPIPSFPYVDAWRLGPDIALNVGGGKPSWFFIVNQARTVAARWAFCHATLCDADPVLLRHLSREEVDMGGWVVAFAGGALFLSDDLRNLPTERRTWGLDAVRINSSLSGKPAIPQDIFPANPPKILTNALIDNVANKNSHVLPTTWVMPDGTRVYLNLTEDEVTMGSVKIPARGARTLP